MTIDAPVAGTVHGLDLRSGAAVQPGAVFAAVGPVDLRPDQWPRLHRMPAGTSAVAARPVTQPVVPQPLAPQPVASPDHISQPGSAQPIPESGKVNAFGLAGLIVGILGFPLCLGTIVGLVLTVVGITRAGGRRDALTTTALVINILGAVAWVAFVIWAVVSG